MALNYTRARAAWLDFPDTSTLIRAVDLNTIDQGVKNVSDAVDALRLDTIAAPTGNVSLNSKKITLLGDPSTPQDAATKSYVDGLGGGSRSPGPVFTTLSASTAAGATTITLNPAPSLLGLTGGAILIDVGSNLCDYVAVTPANVSGNTVTVSALSQAHASGAIVAVINGAIPASYIGCVGGNTLANANRNAAALNRFCGFGGIAMNAGGATIGLDGGYYVNDMVVIQGGHIRMTSMAGIDTSGGLLAYSTFPFAADLGKQILAVCDQVGNVATIKNGLGADIVTWLDNFFLDGGSLANSVLCAHSPQQPGHAHNLRFRLADYGYVFGAQNYWDVQNIQVDQCHVGMVDSHTISAIYNYNYTTPVAGQALAFQFSGNQGAIYGGDLETTNGAGPLVKMDGEGMTLDTLWSSGIGGGGAGTIIEIDRSLSYGDPGSYDIRSFKCNQNSLTVKFLRDLDRNFYLNSMDSGAGSDSPGRYLTALARRGNSFTTYYGFSGWQSASAGVPRAA